MYQITKETLENAYKPFDVVTDHEGNVGLIVEVFVNESQPEPYHQIGYYVSWLTGNNYKVAWFTHDELKRECNLFVKIAEKTCQPMGNNAKWVEQLFKSF